MRMGSSDLNHIGDEYGEFDDKFEDIEDQEYNHIKIISIASNKAHA